MSEPFKNPRKNENRCSAMYGPLLARITLSLNRMACT
jgi:hypothetical protein